MCHFLVVRSIIAVNPYSTILDHAVTFKINPELWIKLSVVPVLQNYIDIDHRQITDTIDQRKE